MFDLRYAPGGEFYNKIAGEYGVDGANKVYEAAQKEEPGAIAEALGELRYGGKLETSTSAIFAQQITTDPFAAPLEAANKGLGVVVGSAIKGIFSNLWVLLFVGVGVAVAYIYLIKKRPL